MVVVMMMMMMMMMVCCSGEVEIHLEPKQHSTQYPAMWSEIQRLLPDLILE